MPPVQRGYDTYGKDTIRLTGQRVWAKLPTKLETSSFDSIYKTSEVKEMWTLQLYDLRLLSID